MTPVNETKASILKIATRLAQSQGFRNVTREAIAEKADIAPGTVSYHFGTMSKLQDAIVVHAVETENLTVIAQGLAERHRKAVIAPASLQVKALNTLRAAVA